MKILLPSIGFPPETHGMAEVAKAHAFGFAARGHEVIVATSPCSSRDPDTFPSGISIFEFNLTGSTDWRTGIQGNSSPYKAFLNSQRPDAVLCNGWHHWATDLTAEKFATLPGKKVFVSHGFTPQIWTPYPRFPWGIPQWTRGLYTLSRAWHDMQCYDHLVFLSDHADFGRFFDLWIARRFGAKNISVIPNGVNYSSVNSAPQGEFRSKYRIDTPLMVLNVANYCDRKNQRATVEAFLRASRMDATMVFIGSEQNEYLASVRLIYENWPSPKPQVLFLENIPRSEIPGAYRDADVFLLLAKSETQPLVLLEAMSAGVPFISTQTGCVDDFKGGSVVKNKSEAAACLDKLLSDPAQRDKLGQAGRSDVLKHYTWEKVIDALEFLLQKARK